MGGGYARKYADDLSGRIAALEAEVQDLKRCNNCARPNDCSGAVGGKCKFATPDNPTGKLVRCG
jgi:hypothetical protein